MEPSVAGRLLVATPILMDPNFFRSVILVLQHDEESGALGLVVNQATGAPVEDFLPRGSPFVVAPAEVFVGGPVQREVAIGLARRTTADEEWWSPVLGNVGLIDLSSEVDEIPGVVELRVFSGYAGWTAGQLEMELLTGSWLILEAEAEDPFTTDPSLLWQRILRRQAGRAALYADFPLDPSMN